MVILVVSNVSMALAQCAMCRASLENNVSNGVVGVSESLNAGILFLLAMPYVSVATIAFLWYKKSKENERKTTIREFIKAKVSKVQRG